MVVSTSSGPSVAPTCTYSRQMDNLQSDADALPYYVDTLNDIDPSTIPEQVEYMEDFIGDFNAIFANVVSGIAALPTSFLIVTVAHW